MIILKAEPPFSPLISVSWPPPAPTWAPIISEVLLSTEDNPPRAPSPEFPRFSWTFSPAPRKWGIFPLYASPSTWNSIRDGLDLKQHYHHCHHYYHYYHYHHYHHYFHHHHYYHHHHHHYHYHYYYHYHHYHQSHHYYRGYNNRKKILPRMDHVYTQGF